MTETNNNIKRGDTVEVFGYDDWVVSDCYPDGWGENLYNVGPRVVLRRKEGTTEQMNATVPADAVKVKPKPVTVTLDADDAEALWRGTRVDAGGPFGALHDALTEAGVGQ